MLGAPYSLEGCLDDITKFPDISSHDITKYLIESPSLHTNETSNVFKSLDGFKFVREGHVQDCFYHESASPSFSIIKSKMSFVSNKSELIPRELNSDSLIEVQGGLE